MKTLLSDGAGINMIKLSSKEMIVSSNWDKHSIDFLDFVNSAKIYPINGKYTFYYSNQMIEISNKFIAISTYSEGYPIKIVDPKKFWVVKEI